jgi:hypothetical protein
MLEFYTMDADYGDSLTITEELFATLLAEGGGTEGTAPYPAELRPPFLRLTMEEAFARWAGFDLDEAAGAGTLDGEARRLGLDPPQGLGQAELYDLIFIHAVEPNLPRDRPVALMDYPAFVPCLAQKRGPELCRVRGQPPCSAPLHKQRGEQLLRYGEGITVVRIHGVELQHGKFRAVKAPGGLPVPKTLADLIDAGPVPGDKPFHPDFR